MSTVTTANCACCGPQSGSGSGSGSGDGGSGSGSGSDDEPVFIPCSSCFGVGTPHPTDAEPVTVDATFLDLGTTFNFVNDGNYQYQCGTAPPGSGFNNLFVGLCESIPGDPGARSANITLINGFANEFVLLTIENCRPFVATGTSSLGPVVVTGNY